MTAFVLLIFKIILYVQLFGCVISGYALGSVGATAMLAVIPGTLHIGNLDQIHVAGLLGAVVGFLIGTTIIGYGLVLLSINDHIADIKNRGDRTFLPRIEPRQ